MAIPSGHITGMGYYLNKDKDGKEKIKEGVLWVIMGWRY